jgi:FkbM family methyltransferase
MQVNEKLIFDIGMHKGEDTSYYLRQGFNVLAVEANPVLANYCRQKFSEAINNGRLTILNCGVAADPGILPFYINNYTSEWSSFDKTIGTRNSPDSTTIDVTCVTTQHLFEQHGIPYYLKVDIEGNDFLCLADIPDTDLKPTYVSCEAVDIEWLAILKNKGYQKFKLINQADGFKPMNIKREKVWYYPTYRKVRNGVSQRMRKVIKFRHQASSSGPFGENSKGKWKSYEEIRNVYLEYYQGDLKTPVNKVSWWDFHAAL